MKIWWILALACFVGASARSAETVGDWGDPSRLEFEGLASFRPEDIRNGLLRHPDFLLASHPAGPLQKYLSAVGEMIRLGYLDTGFAQPKVSVQRDDQRIRVRVVEGPRFRRGQVRLQGAREIPVAAFIKGVTEPMTAAPRAENSGEPGGILRTTMQPAERPVWKKGDYASFTEMAQVQWSLVTSNILEELGWLFAKTQVRLEPDTSRNEVDLIVDILNEGPVGKVGSISVHGQQRDNEQLIIKAAGLKAGMALNRQVLQQAEEKLWETARFLQHHVNATLPENSTLADVVITVREYDKARPLSEEWSPQEQAVLRACDWLTKFPARGDDLVLALTKTDLGVDAIELIFSPDGVLLLVKNGTEGGSAGLIQAGWISQQEASLFSVPQKSRITFQGIRLQFHTSLRLVPNEGTEAEQPFNFSVTGGFKSLAADEPLGAPVVDLRLAPVAFLDMLKREGAKVSLENGQLLVESEQSRLRVEASSGRVSELRLFVDEAELKLALEKGTFRRHQSELRQVMAGFQQVNQPGRSITALAKYAFDELALGPYLRDPAKKPYLGPPEQRQAAAAAWDKLMQSDLLEPLDQLANGIWINTNAFSVPLDARSMGNPMAALVASIAAYVFQLSNELFPKESWPWTVARETVFVLMGRGDYTGQELDRLYGSNEMGPLGYLAVAKLLALAGQKQASLFAIGGLTRLTTSDFRQDWRLLIAGQPAVRQSSTRMATALATLSPAEIEGLSATLEGKDALPALIDMLREKKDEPLEQRLQRMGDLIWERLLKEPVRAELRKLIK